MVSDHNIGGAYVAMPADMQMGLDLWCAGRHDEAIAQWGALAPQDDNARGLLAAVRAAEPGSAQVIDISDRLGGGLSAEEGQRVARSRRLAKALAATYRFGGSLQVLHAVRREYPKVESIPRAIRSVAGRWMSWLTKSLGNLDSVPRHIGTVKDGDYLEGVEDVLALIDGVSTYDEILSCSHLGRLHSCRLLVALKDNGVILAGRSRTSSSVFPPARRRVTHSMLRIDDVRVKGPFESSAPPASDADEDPSTLVGVPEPRLTRRGQVERDGAVPGGSAGESGAKRSRMSTVRYGRPALKQEVSTGALSAESEGPSSQVDSSSSWAVYDGTPPPSKSQTTLPSSGPVDFNTLFKKATRAYLTRELELALRLFDECQKLRPDDTRVAHNVKAVRRRMRKRDDISNR